MLSYVVMKENDSERFCQSNINIDKNFSHLAFTRLARLDIIPYINKCEISNKGGLAK